jgi:sulfite oxidase
VSLSVEDLRARFKHATVVATIECAGNRRSEMKAMPSPGGGGHTIKGLDWAAGAIGTAEWGGARLRDVLLAAGAQGGGPWGRLGGARAAEAWARQGRDAR